MIVESFTKDARRIGATGKDSIALLPNQRMQLMAASGLRNVG
jgi:hypothetical protein